MCLNGRLISVNFNASDFPSGVYYYKIISGDFTETKKMMLLK
ncbi:MAG: T9SS type A sorting domain-containing protein [Ignavibacteria bacterium]|nr:T9SS type A sorting domain-containing protein [Ignavibacteria bacterium]